MTEALSEFDLHAYIDGQLDPGRRYAVEAHLAQHPALAAQMMGELSRGTALRLLAEPAVSAAQPVGRTRAFPWRRLAQGGGLAVAAAICAIVLGPLGQPSYLDMAIASHRVAEMRALMPSQIEAPTLDAREILARTRIDLPPLPASWRITDTQLFPTENGPAVLVAVQTGDGRRMSLFALRKRSSAPEIPDAVREGQHSVAYWRRGDMSYALTGDGDARTMDRIAERLNASWS